MSLVARLRANLLPAEVERFRLLGRICGDAMNDAIRAVRPGMSERELAALLAFEAERRGAQAIVNLIATDERIFRYRHPLPSDKKLDRYAMLVMCGRKWGLVCSVTRLVHFGPLPDELRRKQEALAVVDATYIASTRPNTKLGDIVVQAQAAYAAGGFGGEWRLHHQGGPVGYEAREYLGVPGSEDEVRENQVYAWNPSITGTKMEDTVLIGAEENVVLTAIPGWPTIPVEIGGKVYERPAILVHRLTRRLPGSLPIKDISTMTQPLHGVLAPVLTPMRDDLSPDTPKWIAFCKQLLADGCTGLAPFGTTSEANSLGLDERMEMLDALVEAGVPAKLLMPGVGTCAITDTAKLAAQAARLGCGGVLMLPPFYYKGVSEEGVFRSVAEVVERVGDDRLRVYVYHIPPIAVVGFSLKVIERLIKAYPTTVVGIKDSSGDWNNLKAILESFPGFGTFTGSERFLLPTLRLGGVGTISAMANVIPGRIRQLYDNYLAENADQVQDALNVPREALREYAPIPALKEILAVRTGDTCWRNVRPPLVSMSEQQAAAMLEKYTASGV